MTTVASDTYYPPSTLAATEYGPSGARATGYELECLLKLEESYRVIRASLTSAINQLDEWRPTWNSDYDQLDGSLSEEQALLQHKELVLIQEEQKLARAQAERTSWENSLPSDVYEVGENKAASFRRERARISAEDEARYLANIEGLKSDIRSQREQVTTHHRKVLPVLSVVNFAHSSYILLSSVEDRLSQEHRNIVARLERPIDKVEPDVWSHIFGYAVQIQEEENREALYSGLPLPTLKSPRRTTLSIAGVCRKWRGITQDQQILWQNILVEAALIDTNALTHQLSPRQDPTLRGPISVDVITQNPDNLLGPHPPLLRWIRAFEIASLGVIYSNTPFDRIITLLETVLAGGALRALSLICRDVPSPQRTTISSSLFATIQYLELVDMNLHNGSFGIAMNELTSLHIRYTKVPPFQERLSSMFLFKLVSNSPILEELEVDLGFEDSPVFFPVSFPPNRDALSHLRYLKTRLSYFQNRLSFLHLFPLPAMDSITLSDIPSWASDLEWESFRKVLTTGVGSRIKHCEVLGIIPPKEGTFVAPSFIPPASFMTSELTNLRTLSLHKQAVDHFIDHLRDDMRDGHNPIPKVQKMSLWDAPILGDTLVEFVRVYCDAVLTPSSEGTSNGSIPESARHVQLQSLYVYRCSAISVSALESVTHMLRGSGRAWHEAISLEH